MKPTARGYYVAIIPDCHALPRITYRVVLLTKSGRCFHAVECSTFSEAKEKRAYFFALHRKLAAETKARSAARKS